MDYLGRLSSGPSAAHAGLALLALLQCSHRLPCCQQGRLISITQLHRRDKSVCQGDVIIKLFQRSFNIAGEGLRCSPQKIRLKYDLCVRDELRNKTFRGKMNCPAT